MKIFLYILCGGSLIAAAVCAFIYSQSQAIEALGVAVLFFCFAVAFGLLGFYWTSIVAAVSGRRKAPAARPGKSG